MIVQTKSGYVMGIKESGVYAFKGIPFAKAPVGELRFKPPVAIEPWEGVFMADKFGNRAMQNNEQEYKDEANYSEDCLNLNIWTPGADDKKRPVVFYIHGGGHFSGSNSDEFFDGHHLVKDNEAVMVSINYRLGALGYLYLGEVLGEEYSLSGNCGLLDQILALKWVKENIAAFGGNPDMITLMGQSAGGKSVASLLVTPSVKGMYNKAIIQSGSVQCIRDKKTAAIMATYILSALGLDERSAGKIINIPAEDILKAQNVAAEKVPAWHMFGPVLDGILIQESPEEYIKKGKVGNMPVLIGYNKDELSAGSIDFNFDSESVKERLYSCYGINADHVYKKYLEYCETMHPSLAFGKIQTEYVYGNASIYITDLLVEGGATVWCYRWDFGGKGLAHHFSEMAYIFGYTIEESYKGYYKEYSYMEKIMNGAWMSFILNGDPQIEELPHWIPCRAGEGAYRMRFDSKPYLERFDLQSYDKEFPMQVIKL